jgi:hypothetical protein
MKTFHICYLIGEELCSGINILAKSYSDAESKFFKLFQKKEIVYISKLAN